MMERYFVEPWHGKHYVFDLRRGYGERDGVAVHKALALCNNPDDAERIARLLNADAKLLEAQGAAVPA